MKKLVVLSLILACFLFAACAKKDGASAEGGLSVVTTIFPPYDFARVIAGDRARLSMLLKPGAESHSWEPSPQDIIDIQNCDVFIYVGGESEAWTQRVLESLEPGKRRILSLMESVTPVEEEIVEGMEEEEEEEEGPAYDEHVWTSPVNAKRIVEAITAAFCEADPGSAAFFRTNADAYAQKLDALDAEFSSIVKTARRKTLVFGDRFPFRYFTDAYGLKYFAAFPGCATETEASAATIAFLIDKVRSEQIPIVFTIEFSNGRIADAICEATGAKRQLFHSAHNVSRDDFAAGISYLDIMKRNAEVLKEALN